MKQIGLGFEKKEDLGGLDHGDQVTMSAGLHSDG